MIDTATMAADSDFAFNLQMEEALTASLLDGTVSSPKTDGLPYDAVFGPVLSSALQDDGLYKYECELLDQYDTQAAAKRLHLDLHRQVHDRAFACEISNLPEEEWRKIGDDLQRPYGEGSSSSNERGSGFKVFVKGLLEGISSGIAVAIRDDKDGLVFELSKSLGGKDQNVNEDVVELKALIEGLDAAVMLELKRPTIVTDNRMLYLYVSDSQNYLFIFVKLIISLLLLLLLNRLLYLLVNLFDDDRRLIIYEEFV